MVLVDWVVTRRKGGPSHFFTSIPFCGFTRLIFVNHPHKEQQKMPYTSFHFPSFLETITVLTGVVENKPLFSLFSKKYLSIKIETCNHPHTYTHIHNRTSFHIPNSFYISAFYATLKETSFPLFHCITLSIEQH